MTIRDILEELTSRGMTQVAIAAEVQTTQATISRLLAGQENMGHLLADRIREFYNKLENEHA